MDFSCFPCASSSTLEETRLFTDCKCFCFATEKSCKLKRGSGGNPEQPNATPWLEASWLTVVVCFFFSLCFGQETLSSVTPPRSFFFMAYWPWCSQRPPISALERPLVHFATVEDVKHLLSNDTSYCVTAVFLSWICLCPGATKRAFCLPVWAERLLSFRLTCYQPHWFSCWRQCFSTYVLTALYRD